MQTHQQSELLYQRALNVIPGGVNSPVRAFKGVGGTPLFIKQAQGPHIEDVDGHLYIDYVGSWGPMVLGHAHPQVIESVQQHAQAGLSFGAPCLLEIEVAEKLCELVPALESVRMVSSGTEATMSAIRLARGYTGRNKIIKFEGCYHGHSDALLVKAGSGALTLGVPSSPGVPEAVAEHTMTLSYNDLDSVREAFASHATDIACVMVEPVAGNMGCIPPVDGFLQGLRELCTDAGAVLIFDEVMTGCRVALGGAQQYYQVTPDLTTLGKVIGGGMPVGAFGGKREIMEHIAPSGPVYQAGTLSGNPVAMAAGLKTLELVSEAGFYQRLSDNTAYLVKGIENAAKQAGIALSTHAVGGMFGLFFTEQKVTSFEQVMAADQDQFRRFFHGMLAGGVYLAPSAFEAGFVSAAHEQKHLDATINLAEQVFATLK